MGSLSPASIRNVMADLDEDGYLYQPHTSAGRLPTEKAFRFFVREISLRQPSPEELERLRQQFVEVDNAEDWVGLSSRVLTEMTGNVGIAAAAPTNSRVLDQIELVPLAGRRVLVVVITRDRVVRNRVVTVDEEISSEEATSIRNYLNHHFSGWTLSDTRAELERRLRLQSAYYDSLLQRLTTLYSKGVLDIDSDPEVHLQGAASLIGLDLHLTRTKMQQLLRALEEKKKIVQLLDRFLTVPPGEVTVQIGLGELHPAMKELSLIGINVGALGSISARIAVLGPMRMDYAKVMTAVLQVGEAVQQLTS
jgi:heat-inducible transcriptional repressor